MTDPTPSKWKEFIAPFANSIKLEEGKVEEALKGLVGEPDDDAVGLLQDETMTPFESIKTCFPDVADARLRKAVADLRKKQEVPLETSSRNIGPLSDNILPDVPDDMSFLDMLRTGGELKVDKTAVISAIRAALASRVNLYGLPEILVKRMEEHAEELDEPVPPTFFRLRKLLVRRNYAELFAAIEGLDGNFVTQGRKDELLRKLEDSLWGAIASFHEQLKGWMESWQQGMANPAALMSLFVGNQAGGIMPPNFSQPPETSTLRDAAEGFIDKVNRIFSGVGIPIARALAFDAQNIKTVLETPELPGQVGATNREQMLKMLGVSVASDFVRLERNVTKYVLGVMELPKITSGNEEYQYLGALFMLGNQIPWMELNNPSGRRSGRRSTSSSMFDEDNR